MTSSILSIDKNRSHIKKFSYDSNYDEVKGGRKMVSKSSIQSSSNDSQLFKQSQNDLNLECLDFKFPSKKLTIINEGNEEDILQKNRTFQRLISKNPTKDYSQKQFNNKNKKIGFNFEHLETTYRNGNAKEIHNRPHNSLNQSKTKKTKIQYDPLISFDFIDNILEKEAYTKTFVNDSNTTEIVYKIKTDKYICFYLTFLAMLTSMLYWDIKSNLKPIYEENIERIINLLLTVSTVSVILFSKYYNF